MELFHAKLEKEISSTKVSNRLRMFRPSMGLPEVQTRIQCRPSTSLPKYVGDREFQVCLQFCCQMELFSNNTICPRPNTSDTLDAYGDNLLFTQRSDRAIIRRSEESIETPRSRVASPRHVPRTTRHRVTLDSGWY